MDDIFTENFAQTVADEVIAPAIDTAIAETRRVMVGAAIEIVRAHLWVATAESNKPACDALKAVILDLEDLAKVLK